MSESVRKTIRHFESMQVAHELTFSCYKRQRFLSKDRTCKWLSEAINMAKEKHGFDIWAYVFMPEHVHLLVWPKKSDSSISDFLHTLKKSVSRKALSHVRQHSPESLLLFATGEKHVPYRFWQAGPGFDRNVDMNRVLWNMIVYIHNNPVRRGLVLTPDDWMWSSAKDWNGTATGPVILNKDSFPFA